MPVLLFVLAGCTTTPEAEDHALFLGAGVITDDIGGVLVRAREEEVAPPTRMIGEDGHAWTGEVALTWEPPPDTDACARADRWGWPAPACEGPGSVAVTLVDVVIHDGGQAEQDDCWAETPCDAEAGFDLDPPTFHLDGSFVLDLTLDGPYEEGAFALTAATHAPALLRASALWIDRAAMVTLRYRTVANDYDGIVTVRGTVDGVESGYDYAWMD